MAVTDFNSKKDIKINSASDSVEKAQEITLDGSVSEGQTGTGVIGYDTTNVSDATDVAFFQSDGSTLRDYWIENPEDLGTTNKVYVHVYGNFTADDSVQIVFAYGNGSADNSVADSQVFKTAGSEMGYTYSTGSGDLVDRTGNGRNIESNTVTSRSVDGITDGGFEYDGTDDNSVDNNSEQYGISDALTIINHIRPLGTGNNSYNRYVSIDDLHAGGNTQIIILSDEDDGQRGAYVRIDGNDAAAYDTSGTIPKNTDLIQAMRWRSSDGQLDYWENGSQNASTTATTASNTSANLKIAFSDSSDNRNDHGYHQQSHTVIYSGYKSDAFLRAHYDATSVGGRTFFVQEAAETTTTAITDTATPGSSQSRTITAKETGSATSTGTTASSQSTGTTSTIGFTWEAATYQAYGEHQYGSVQPFGVVRAIGTITSSKTSVETAQETGSATYTGVTASSTTSSPTALAVNMILTDTSTAASSITSVPEANDAIFGIPGEVTVYIDNKRYSVFTDIDLKTRINEVDTFSFQAFIEDDTDRQFIQEGKEIKVFEGNNFLFKGVMNEVDYKSSFRAEVEGNGMTQKLLDRKTNRDTYTNTAGDDIVRDVVSTDAVTLDTVEDAPIVSVRFDHDNEARAVAGVANATGYDWYIDQKQGDSFDTDYLNFVQDAGRDTSQATLRIGEDAQMVDRDKDDGFVANNITLLGRGDGINQLEAQVYAASTAFTDTTQIIGENESTSFQVDNAEELGSIGDNLLIRAGVEVMDVTISDSTTLSINSRGLNDYNGDATPQIEHYNGLRVWRIENKTTGTGRFTPETRDTAEDGSSIDSKGVKEQRETDKTIVDLRTLEKVADLELKNRFEDVFRVQVKPTDPRITQNLELGDTVKVEDLTAMDVSDEFEVVGFDVKRASTEEGTTLHLANRPRRLTERLSDIESDTDTLNAHMQGATNFNGERFEDNADNTHPLSNKIFVPDDVVEINKFQLTFARESFRGYVQNTDHSHSVSIDVPSHTHGIDELPDHTHDLPATIDIEIKFKEQFNSGFINDGSAGNDHTHLVPQDTTYFNDAVISYIDTETTEVHNTPSTTATSKSGGFASVSDTSSSAGKPEYGIFEPGTEPDIDVEVYIDNTLVDTINNVSVGDEITTPIDLKQSLSDPLTGTYHEIELVPIDTGGGNNGRCRLTADVVEKVFIESTL